MQKIFASPRVSPKDKQPRLTRGGQEYDRTPVRLPFIHLSEPQRLQLESAAYAVGAALFTAACVTIAVEPEQSAVTGYAFAVFATLTVACASGWCACFHALREWEANTRRTSQYYFDGMEHWRDRFYVVSQRGTVAGSAGNGMRALNPLPAEVFNLSDHRRH